MSIPDLASVKRFIRLIGINGSGEGRTWESFVGLRIGRIDFLQMVLDDASVSHFHAKVRCSEREWVVEDCNSTNGTFLNGVRLNDGCWPLRLGDELRFGNVTFRVESLVFEDDSLKDDYKEDDEWSLASMRLDPTWLTWNNGAVKKIAETIIKEARFDLLPIMADSLEEAGCAEKALLEHCRAAHPLAKTCWVVNILLSMATKTKTESILDLGDNPVAET